MVCVSICLCGCNESNSKVGEDASLLSRTYDKGFVYPVNYTWICLNRLVRKEKYTKILLRPAGLYYIKLDKLNKCVEDESD